MILLTKKLIIYSEHAFLEDEEGSRPFPELHIAVYLLEQFHVALADVFVEFCLSLNHAFKRTESLDVRFAYVGDETAVRLHDAGEQSDFAHVVGASFDDGKLVFVGEAE